MNKTPIARKSQEVKVSPLTITSPRQPRLPLSVQGISQLLRKSDDNAQKDFGTSMEWKVGRTPFVLYCSEHDPQGMIQHAVAALQITHKMLWQEPGFRRDNKVAFVIEGVGSFEVSPRSNSKRSKFFCVHKVPAWKSTCRLPTCGRRWDWRGCCVRPPATKPQSWRTT